MIRPIVNKNDLSSIFVKYSPDCVIHLAAETHVDRSIESPFKFIETNVVGTFNLIDVSLDFIKKNNPKNFRFLHVSTDEVFGSLTFDKKTKFDEDTSYNPNSPYSASKASSDHLVRSWFKTYKLPILITNCSNNFGPYQFPEKLIPLIIINALSEKCLPIYGDGQNIRDWLYVEDHANALLVVLEKGEIGRSYNIGSDNERSNIQIVTMICKILDKLRPRPLGSYIDLIKYVKDRPGHDKRYAINAQRIKSELNWKAKYTFEESLKKTVEWYINNENWWTSLIKV